MKHRTSDTISLMACGLGMLSTLGFLPAQDSLPAPFPQPHVTAAHAAAPDVPPVPWRVLGPDRPTSATTARPVPAVATEGHTNRPEGHTNKLQAHTSSTLPTVGVVPNPGVLLHAPSVTVAIIGRELARAGAPFAGEVWDHKPVAQYIYDAARWWGLDPAMVLAFAHHESQYGTVGMATQTRGPCNIRPSGNQPSLNNYRTYPSWQAGVDDCIRLLGRYGRDYGHNQVDNAVNTWAPVADQNNVGAYIDDVVQTVSRLTAESR